MTIHPNKLKRSEMAQCHVYHTNSGNFHICPVVCNSLFIYLMALPAVIKGWRNYFLQGCPTCGLWATCGSGRLWMWPSTKSWIYLKHDEMFLWLPVTVYLMWGPKPLFFQCGPEMPKGWTPLAWILNRCLLNSCMKKPRLGELFCLCKKVLELAV